VLQISQQFEKLKDLIDMKSFKRTKLSNLLIPKSISAASRTGKFERFQQLQTF
jgi:hypothetical protein